MPLSHGERVGPYELLAPIGAGGMGEVWKARDTRLERIVALKFSREQFNKRFDREAKAISALNHPNICTLYDVGLDYLVMEYVEGSPLVSKEKPGPLPMAVALKHAIEICGALDHAHKHGITHRDLKPANILATKAGIKLLDFGLAKLASPGIGHTPTSQDETLSMALTQKNQIVGTLLYMSPEQLQAQATGTDVDGRSDIFSFGIVLYELLTGKRPFEGKSPASIIAAIMERPAPSIMEVSPALDRLLQRCLAKDPDDRWQSARDLKAELEWIANAPALSGAMDNVAPVASAKGSRLAWIAAGALGLSLVGTGFAWWRATRPVDRPLVRLSVDLGPDADRDVRLSAVISPDGSRIVYSAKGPIGLHRLYTRRLDQSAATLLTPSAVLQSTPRFSPNGEWVIYWDPSNSKLMKVPSQGGEPIAIGATPPNFVGASWGDDDNIIMGSAQGLWRVPARGGTAERINGTTGAMGWPQVLPGGQAALIVTTQSGVTIADHQDIDVVQLSTGQKKNLIHGGYWPQYLPTSNKTGHIVYISEGALYGVGYDPRSSTLLGTPVLLLNDVAVDNSPATVGGQYSVSNMGTLVYLSGKPQDAAYPISWMDASGKVTKVVTQPGAYGTPRVSPDGKLLAYTSPSSNTSGNGSDLWVLDLARGTPTQLTFTGEVVDEIAWALDSKHLVYEDGKSLWWIRSDGARQKQLLLDGKELGPTTGLGPRPYSFSPSRLSFSPVPGGLPDVWTLPVDLKDPENPKAGKAEPFVNSVAVEVNPAFSPDGKFIVYNSNESDTNQYEIFVRPFPGPGGKWKVGTGAYPAWSPATREIFFLGTDNHIMVAPYTIQGESFSAGIPRVWSPTPIRRHGVQLPYDISPDGKRVIMFPQPAVEATMGNLHATFLLNFFDEVRRKIPTR